MGGWGTFMEYVKIKKNKVSKELDCTCSHRLNFKTMITQLKDVRHHLAWIKYLHFRTESFMNKSIGC